MPNFQVVMPLDVGILIPEDATVHSLKEITDKLDFSNLNRRYIRKPGRREATPKQLLEIIILGFMKCKYSLREIEEACRYDICFRYLLGGCRVPDHSRIGRFIRERLLGGTVEELFYRVVHELESRGEISGENLFVDGTKIEANANRYSYVWSKKVGTNARKLADKTAALLEELSQIYAMELSDIAGAGEVLERLEALAQKQGIVFVHGCGKRKTQLQKHIEVLREFISKGKSYDDSLAIMGENRSSYSKTDHDATFMRMKEDHLGKGQLKPAYNVQLGVDSEYIVGLDVSAHRNDVLALVPLLKRMKQKGGLTHKKLTCDAGYDSEENHTYAEENGQIAFIKPQNYEKSKTRGYKTNAFLRENMPYNPEKDEYTCPAGHSLQHQGDRQRTTKSGFKQVVSVYETEACTGCPLKEKCTRAKENRVLVVSKTFLRQRATALDRFTSEEGVLLRMNRSIQVEGAFGVLKEDWGFRRFVRRGSVHVETEMFLYAIAFNVKKLHNKRTQNRLKTHLLYPQSIEKLLDTG